MCAKPKIYLGQKTKKVMIYLTIGLSTVIQVGANRQWPVLMPVCVVLDHSSSRQLALIYTSFILYSAFGMKWNWSLEIGIKMKRWIHKDTTMRGKANLNLPKLENMSNCVNATMTFFLFFSTQSHSIRCKVSQKPWTYRHSGSASPLNSDHLRLPSFFHCVLDFDWWSAQGNL